MLKLKCYRVSDISDCSFKKAIIDPEKVIAPTTKPIDISIALIIFISLPEEIPNFSGA